MLYPFVGLACKPSNIQIAAFAYAFEQRGLKWAKYIVAAGAAIGVFTSSGIALYGLSRVFQVFAREGILPPVVGRINGFTNTPIIAVAIATIACGMFIFLFLFSRLGRLDQKLLPFCSMYRTNGIFHCFCYSCQHDINWNPCDVLVCFFLKV